MKKIIIIILIISSCFIFFNRNKIFVPKTIKQLTEIGYSKKEIDVISKLDENNINIIIKNNYIKDINKLLNNKNFNEEKLNMYLDLLIKNIKLDDVLYIVNNNYYNKNINYDEHTINLMKEKYYIHKNLSRYLSYDKSELSYDEIIKRINSNLDYDFYNHDIVADTSKDNLILVNKFYKLDKDFIPSNLVTIDNKYGGGQVKRDVYEAFINMNSEANKNGLNLKITSPYRSYNVQSSLYNRYVTRDGIKSADTYSARAGYSEHQTGLALDIVTSTTTLGTFETSKEFDWLQKNCFKFGFILRYPKDKEYITGYQYESWHYRYVGIDIATKINELGITYEEYYEYFVK